VDKEVRDTWEMDASKVKFLNTGWEKWIQETIVKEVCAALGVNVEASKPRAELYKLLVYETGSQYVLAATLAHLRLIDRAASFRTSSMCSMLGLYPISRRAS
jgi:hypothetical protein